MKIFLQYITAASLLIVACSSEMDMQPQAQSCLKLTSSPPSYSDKLCPSEFNVYSFLCDANSTDPDIRLAFSTIHQKHYYGHDINEATELRNQTGDYKYHFSLPILERVGDYYTMRSSLTVWPQHSLVRFPVISCTTHCGHTPMTKQKTYMIAELPTMPRNLGLTNSNRKRKCTGGPRAYYQWEHPENFDMSVVDHYEYIFNHNGDIVKTFDTNSLHYLDVDLDEVLHFEVYAVDKCGRHGQRAEINRSLRDEL